MLHLSSEASHIPHEGHHRSSNCTGLGRNYHRSMSISLICVNKFPFLKSHRTATGFSKLLEVHQMVLLARSLLSVRSPGMPLKITGRLTVKVCSSSSVYSVLAPLEIPVAIIQSVSENSPDIQLKLSNPIVFFGFRNSVVLGSTVFKMMLHINVLPTSLSP